MSTLETWIDDTSAALNLPSDTMDVALRDELLDVTRDVAHGVARVAGPLTTYLIGFAVGAGMPRAEAIRIVSELAAAHAGDETTAE
ncbi:MAG: DUF6457 domain-containing protein [Nakamurella sp.]